MMIRHASLGLALHGAVQSNLVWHFTRELKKTSHTEVPNLRGKNLVLHLNKYGNL
jgi:hypothetical protein